MNGPVPVSPLRVSGLRVRYPNGSWALRGVHLDVAAGRLVAVVGESGCGKTTLVRAVLGLLPRHSLVQGSVVVDGVETVRASARQRRALRGLRVGVVGQNPFGAFDPLHTVGHHVHEAWLVHGTAAPVGRVTGLLAELGIVDPERTSRQYPHQWSGGMLQRAAIAAAQAHDPPLLVADEPTSALDAELADQTVRALRRRSSGVLLVTHDLALAARHADEVAVMYAGRVVETGSAETVLHDPRHPYTRALLASVPRPGAGLPVPLPGSPPDLHLEPAGCAFVDRCPMAGPPCHDRDPRLVAGVACHLEQRHQSEQANPLEQGRSQGEECQ